MYMNYVQVSSLYCQNTESICIFLVLLFRSNILSSNILSSSVAAACVFEVCLLLSICVS
jgi:hypothetical protein